jgi:MFS family permease
MSPRERSLAGLDGLNFFVANIQAGFGPFITVYLTGQHWTQVDIGLALSIGTVASMVGQVPAGALVDWMQDKRRAAFFGLVGILTAAMLTALSPAQISIIAAQVLHGFCSSMVSPAIAAISLAIVGLAGMGERAGRNARFGSLGNGIAAALMGGAASLISERSVFLLAALFTLPALFTLRLIATSEIHTEPEHADGVINAVPRARLRHCVSPGLVVFGAAIFLFQLSNAALLPLVGIEVTKQAGNWAGAIIAACVVVPQFVVAAVSPTVGSFAQTYGRRWILVFGFCALPARALLLAAVPDAFLVVPVQALDGITAAVMGVMVPLVAADLTRGTGRYNLIQGTLGLVGGLGATFSTSVAGFVAQKGGSYTAFVGLAVVGALAVLVLALAMPETRRADSLPPGLPATG